MAKTLLRKFSFKLTLAFCGTLILAMGLTSLLLTRNLKKIFIGELTADLYRSAELIRSEVDPLTWEKNPNTLQSLAVRFSQAGACRVTLIRVDGVVLADSSLTLSEVSKVENHHDRPEVLLALNGQSGTSIRTSHTIKQDLLYAAVPISHNSKVVGVVRLALPLTQVQKKLAHVQKTILWISLIILLFSLTVALRLSRSLSRPLREMSTAAESIAQGNFSVRIKEASSAEFDRLGATLNYLVERVQTIIQELTVERAQLSSILTNMVEAVAAVDAQGRVVVINPTFSRLFEIDFEQARGTYFLEVLRHHRINQLLQQALKDGATQVDEVQVTGSELRAFEVHAAPLNEGEIRTGALVVLHDITRIRRLEQIRKDFVANVSHELRTPLSSIKGFAETLRTGALDDKKHRMEFVESIESQADRMSQLVSDLLDLTQIESGKKPLVRTPVHMKNLIQQVVNDLKPLAERKTVVVRSQELEKLAIISVDFHQMKQVFLNLLDNAIKFNRENGSVLIAGSTDASSLTMTVTDTGVGISSEDLPRIFERFYRVDKARSQELGGTGLGLSIVKHIVEAHGGTVSVKSNLGKGSTFEVVLPLS